MTNIDLLKRCREFINNERLRSADVGGYVEDYDKLLADLDAAIAEEEEADKTFMDESISHLNAELPNIDKLPTYKNVEEFRAALRENEAARQAITQANAYATSIASYLAVHGFTYNGTEYPKWVEWNRNHPETCPGLTPYPAPADKEPK